MNPSTVSLIIPAFDGQVKPLLARLKQQSLLWQEALVVTATSPAARARNLGAQMAVGKYLIFVDDDVTLSSPTVLENVIQTLEKLDPRDAINITWRLTPDANWVQRKLAGNPLFTFDRSKTPSKLSWRECGAACFAIHTRRFQELGGYDETLVSGEDCDLAYRIVQAGGTLYTLPDCWLDHQPAKSIVEAIRKTFWYEHGNAQVARKHPQAGYRIVLASPWKAMAYLGLRTVALLPLMCFRVNYRQRWPKLALRPFETLLSYIGAWAYVREWLLPGKAPIQGTIENVRMITREKIEAA